MCNARDETADNVAQSGFPGGHHFALPRGNPQFCSGNGKTARRLSGVVDDSKGGYGCEEAHSKHAQRPEEFKRPLQDLRTILHPATVPANG